MMISIVHACALIMTFLIFGPLGYRLSKKIKRPVSLVMWIFVVLLTLAAGASMPSAILVGIFEFKIFLCYSLMALGTGMIAGLAMREVKLRTNSDQRV